MAKRSAKPHLVILALLGITSVALAIGVEVCVVVGGGCSYFSDSGSCSLPTTPARTFTSYEDLCIFTAFPGATGNIFVWGMIDQQVHYQSYLNYESVRRPEQPGLFQSTITGIGSLVVIYEYELIAILKQNTLIKNFTRFP